MKICNKCQINKPLVDFYKCKTATDGYRGACKHCVSEQKKQKYNSLNNEEIKMLRDKHKEWNANNKDKIKEYSEKARSKQSTKERMKKYYQDNKEALINYKKDYHIQNQEKHIKLFEEYRKKDDYKFIRRALAHNFRSKKLGIDGILKKEELVEKIDKQDNKCYYCSVNLDFTIKGFVHIDHKIPLSRGGQNIIENIVWCCSNCNLKKGVKLAT